MKKKRMIVLFVVIAMTFMATLDSSIINVALPVLASKLNVSLSSIEWVIASYSIIICSTLLFLEDLGILLINPEYFNQVLFFYISFIIMWIK